MSDPLPGGGERLVIPRQVQLVLLGAALLFLWVALRAARHVALIFVVAGLIALMLNPFVAFLQRRRVPRRLAIPLTYLSLFATLALLGFALSSPISTQVAAFTRTVPSLVHAANKNLDQLQQFFNARGVHLTLKSQGQTALQALQQKIVKESSSVVSFSGSILKVAANAALSILLIFVLSVYMLIYGERIGALVRRVLPAGDGTPADNYPLSVQRAVSGYIRGQLLFSVVMGTTAGLALFIFGLLGVFPDGRTYAFAFGSFFAVMELVPFIGPLLGALPPIAVALFTDPITAVWVSLLFLGIQQVEGHIVAPQIFSHALQINPLLIIFALLFGDAVYGLIGALVALPLAAVMRETVLYLRRHVVFESWQEGRT